MNLDHVRDVLGFDESERDETDDKYLRIRCSCCAALVINGTPCHERGCPNQARDCRECGNPVPAGESCNCMDPVDDPSLDDEYLGDPDEYDGE